MEHVQIIGVVTFDVDWKIKVSSYRVPLLAKGINIAMVLDLPFIRKSTGAILLCLEIGTHVVPMDSVTCGQR